MLFEKKYILNDIYQSYKPINRSLRIVYSLLKIIHSHPTYANLNKYQLIHFFFFFSINLTFTYIWVKSMTFKSYIHY